MIIRKEAYPRAGLVGNPSDGYFGKTIAFTFSNFCARVTLYETPELEILPNTRDHSRFTCINGLTEDVRLYGYYGGIRLLKAAIKRFHGHCRKSGASLHTKNFTVRYESDIPHMVGLAGSSAIITACMHALMEYYDVDIPQPELANLVLSVETEELGISAGLQDRVAQVYQGLVHMDFDKSVMESQGYGRYEPIPVETLPPLYIAYRADLSQVSDIVHNDLRGRFQRGDPAVLEAICFWAELTDQVGELLKSGKGNEIGGLLDANFDRRASLFTISDGNMKMVEAARAVGASAKFTGSGGAIVGTYPDDAALEAMAETLRPLGVEVIRPAITPPQGEEG